MKQRLSNSKSYTTIGWLLIYYVLFSMPMVKYYVNTYISMGILVLLCYMLMLQNADVFYSPPKIIVAVLMFLIITLMEEVYIQNQLLYVIWSVFLDILPLLIGVLLINMEADVNIRRTVWLVMLVYVVIAITTYQGLQKYPMASRDLASDANKSSVSYTKLNIGGFEFIYSIPVILPMIICVLRRTKKTWLAIIITLILGQCVLESQYTFAVIAFMLSLAAYFLPVHNGDKVARNRIALLVFLLVVAVAFADDIFMWLSELEMLENSSDKLKDIANVLKGKSAVEGNTIARQQRYRMSWDLFLENMLFGARLFDYREGGGHSYFLDMMAYWGIIGLSIVAYLVVQLASYYKKIADGDNVYLYAMCSLGIALLVSAINPQFWTFELGMVVPLCIYYTTHLPEKKEKVRLVFR